MCSQSMRIVCLIAAAAMAVAGCQDEKKRPVVEEPVVTAPGSVTKVAARALDATGGLDAWQKARSFSMASVVAYYRVDRSTYLTEHGINVRPWSNTISISANEPQGQYQWDLQNGQFTVQGPGKDVSLRQVSARDVAEAVLMLVTAPVRMLDSTARFDPSPEAVKLTGTWYEPLGRAYVPDPEQEVVIQPYWSSVIFYQNRNNGRIDTIMLDGGDGNVAIAVRGYDYVPVQGTKAMVPTKIEIYRTNARHDLEERLLQIAVQ